MLRHLLRALHSEDRGQDLAEYCLLTALVALVGMVIFVHLSGGVQALWGDANTSLTAGNAAISATTGSSTATSAPGH
jgi:Flp pilus assembly pilin Flp